jgi:hypothetical protein
MTYRQVIEDVRARHHKVMQPCWIAHVKRLNGLQLPVAHNRRDPHRLVKPCPNEQYRRWIEASMRRFGMLP